MRLTQLLRWTVMAVIVVMISFFAEANRGAVTVNFWPFSLEITTNLALLVLASVIFGILCGMILCAASVLKWRHRAKKYQKQITQLERQSQAETLG